MSDNQDKLDSLKALFNECWQDAAPYFDRADAVQKAYEEGPDSERGSDVNFPLIWQLVESALPAVWQGAFPRQNFLQAVSKTPMSFEQRFSLERFAEHQITLAGLKSRGLLTIKDSLKYGRGYGAIEDTTVRVPKEVVRVLVTQNGVEGGMTVETDQFVTIPKYVYLPYQYVIPTGETDNVDDTSGLFVFRPLTETQLRAMYEADDALPEDQRRLKLSAESVLKRTEEAKLNCRGIPLLMTYANIGGDSDAMKRLMKREDMQRSMQNYKEHNKALFVPILQCKFHNEEIWIANDNQIIYESKGKKGIRKDVVTASVFPDSDNWWCHGIGSRSLDLDAAQNILFRMMLDIAARFGDPVSVLNSTLLENVPDEVNPGDQLKARMLGPSQRALDYVTGPDVPQSLMALGMQMVDQGSRTAGINPQAAGQGSPGVMRAGSAGFESWLATATGREKMMEGSIREDWLLPTIQLIMLHTRMNMGVKEQFAVYDVSNGEYVQKTVTKDAFAAVSEWKWNLEAKYDLSSQEKGLRLSTFVQTMKDNPMFDQEACAVWAAGDDPTMERLIATPEKRKAQEEAMQRRAQAQQQAEQQRPEPGMESQATQGMAANM